MSLILLVGEDGKKIGEMPIEEAERIAAEVLKDLQMVDGEKRIYRVVDAGKLEYERRKKIKKNKAQQRTHKVKEIKFGVTIEQHDIDIKVSRVREFLKKGLKTKVIMQFKGRQMSFQDIGLAKMKSIIEASCAGGLARVDGEPKFEGINLIAFLIPIR